MSVLPAFPPRLQLAHLPTPLWTNAALNRLLGLELWVKRDDMTSGAAAGNKIRKLEFLLAEAQAEGATTLVTCGGLQSNHARATALLGCELGMQSVLLLRTPIPEPPPLFTGNALLGDLAGAELRLVTPSEYQSRNTLMERLGAELLLRGEQAYLIPEGGSNGLGAFGYIRAMQEISAQCAAHADAPKRFDLLVHACGSGGTAAGVALGNALTPVADRLCPVPVCDDAESFRARTTAIEQDARQYVAELPPPSPLDFMDGFQGPGYGVSSPEQLAFLRQVASRSGLMLDPVYTGKALYALSQLRHKPKTALFLHTGGLPGLLAEADVFLS